MSFRRRRKKSVQTVEDFLEKIDTLLGEEGKEGEEALTIAIQCERNGETVDLSDTRDIHERKPGTYRIFDTKTDEQIGDDLVIRQGGIIRGQDVDPVVSGARSAAMLSEGWAQLTQAQQRIVESSHSREEELRLERDALKEKVLSLEAQLKNEESPVDRWIPLVANLANSWINRDERETVAKFVKRIAEHMNDPEAVKQLEAAARTELNNPAH